MPVAEKGASLPKPRAKGAAALSRAPAAALGGSSIAASPPKARKPSAARQMLEAEAARPPTAAPRRMARRVLAPLLADTEVTAPAGHASPPCAAAIKAAPRTRKLKDTAADVARVRIICGVAS